MPYIKKELRSNYAEEINSLILKVDKEFVENHVLYEGHLNYIFSKIIKHIFLNHISYANGNAIVGMLECVKQEFYRRYLAPYEDLKIKDKNFGDI